MLINRVLKARYPLTKTFIKPVFFVIHHTGSLTDCALYLGDNPRKVSVHWHINRQGVLTEYANVANLDGKWAKKANHAGQSSYNLNGKQYYNLNGVSVGVELDGDGKTPFAPEQITKLAELTRKVIEVYEISPDAVVGHKEIAPGRKVDPAPFDMAAWRSMFRPARPAESEAVRLWRELDEELQDDPEALKILHQLRKLINLK